VSALGKMLINIYLVYYTRTSFQRKSGTLLAGEDLKFYLNLLRNVFDFEIARISRARNSRRAPVDPTLWFLNLSCDSTRKQIGYEYYDYQYVSISIYNYPYMYFTIYIYIYIYISLSAFINIRERLHSPRPCLHLFMRGENDNSPPAPVLSYPC